jgi:lipopolysaccharide transport system ATP-binding protein
MVSVHLKNVTVSFPIYDARSRSLKRRAMSVVTGGRVRSDPTGRISTDASHRVSIRALDRIDLAIEHGAHRSRRAERRRQEHAVARARRHLCA